MPLQQQSYRMGQKYLSSMHRWGGSNALSVAHEEIDPGLAAGLTKVHADRMFVAVIFSICTLFGIAVAIDYLRLKDITKELEWDNEKIKREIELDRDKIKKELKILAHEQKMTRELNVQIANNVKYLATKVHEIEDMKESKSDDVSKAKRNTMITEEIGAEAGLERSQMK